jgi:hypothetical protein
MKHYFDCILREIYKPSKEFFIKGPYPYLSKCTDALKALLQLWPKRGALTGQGALKLYFKSPELVK